LQSRHARPFLRRPQRPGARNAFTLWEPLRQFAFDFLPELQSFSLCREPFGSPGEELFDLCSGKLSVEPPQNQPFAITGSVTFTPAVIAMSRI